MKYKKYKIIAFIIVSLIFYGAIKKDVYRQVRDNQNLLNDIYRQQTPEEEWLIRLFAPCEPSNPKAQFLMPSEILTRINAHSGMKLSIRRLTQAMTHLNFGDSISKRFKGRGCRKVYLSLIHI